MKFEDAMNQTTDWIRRHSIEINDYHLRELKKNTDLDIHVLLNSEKERVDEGIRSLI